MIKRIVPAQRHGSTGGGAGDAAYTPIANTGGIGGALFIHSHEDRIRYKICKAMERNLPVVLSRRSLEATADSLTAMYTVALRSLCSATTYVDNAAFQRRARAILPGIATLLSWRELSRCGDLRSQEQCWLRVAFQLLNERREWSTRGHIFSPNHEHWTVDGWATAHHPTEVEFGPGPPSAPPSDYEIRLSCQLDRAASSVLSGWTAMYLLKRIAPLTTAGTTTAPTIDLDTIEILLGGVRTVDRKAQYDTWSEHQKRIECPVSVVKFCEAAGVSHSAFYSKWFGYIWLDTDPEGERILNLLSRSWTKFPR